jgi:uncharacterized protein
MSKWPPINPCGVSLDRGEWQSPTSRLPFRSHFQQATTSENPHQPTQGINETLVNDITWQNCCLLFGSAVLGGAVNAVAGGGTLLTFPALLWAGQLEIVANATSCVALWPGALSSFWTYRSELRSSRRELAVLAIPSVAGGIVGAVLLLGTSNATFAAIVPYLILLATLLFILQTPLARWRAHRAVELRKDHESAPLAVQEHEKPATLARWTAVLLFQFVVAVYGGYFGAGIGILMLAGFGYLGFTNIHHMNALKNLNAMCINGVAAALFIGKGLVDWRLALLMAAGAIFGGFAGAGAARRVGQPTVRRMIILIGFSLSIWLLLRQMR